MASRPSLQLFPPAEKKLTKKDSRKSPVSGAAPKLSLDTSKPAGELHELIIQVPAATHQRPTQIHYSPPQQHTYPDRGHSVSPIKSPREDFYVDQNGASSSISPHRGYPMRSTSLGRKASQRKRAPTPQSGMRMDSAIDQTETPRIQRAASVRSPEKQKRAFSPAHTNDQRVVSPVSGYSGSPTLVRTMSGRTAVRSPVSPEEYIPMQSIFPQYDHSTSLSQQDYAPVGDVASPAQIPMEKISRAPYSPPPDAQNSARPMFVTPASELNRLWDFANGQPTTPVGGPTNFTLQLNRPNGTTASGSSAKERPRITFGSNPKKPFYSLRQSNLEPEVVSDPSGNTHQLEEHELLVFRHHPNRPDVLPIAHMDVSPPPPPSLSTTHSLPVASSSGFPIDVEANATDATHLPHHITTIAPSLASLTALRAAANSPAAASLASMDPNANSPQVRRLAEDAVRSAEEQESVEVLWRRTSPRTGVYELLHPALGVLKMSVEGNICGKLDNEPGPKSSARARVALMNPSPSSTDVKYEYRPVEQQAPELASSELVSLDLATGLLDVDTAALAALRNPFLADVAVCAVFAVAVAESRRAQDPGLTFEAPPSPQFKGKGTSKPKPKSKKQQQKRLNDDWEEKELPRSARGIIAILSFIFKSALWTVGLGLRMIFGILRGVGKCFSVKM